ncbi:MAG: hypothetical protein KatS3mg023_1811 [Armatimonadota bacterium]|nr:MAG: hypothetical protein KatS3mg023_1811 [Armatimonadota bacterium]
MRSRILFVLLQVLCIALASTGAPEITGTVVGVHDGDTVTVLTKDRQQFKIRLYGIDAPETRQPFGNRAKRYLSDLIFNKHVRVSVKGKDRYGRVLGVLFLNGKDINAVIVRDGYAWAYVRYSRQYVLQEKQARSAKRGLWSQHNPVPPWEWRHGGSVKPSQQQTTIDPLERIVYITRTGERYHVAGCRYLARSMIPIKLKDALALGYTPCKICNP